MSGFIELTNSRGVKRVVNAEAIVWVVDHGERREVLLAGDHGVLDVKDSYEAISAALGATTP